MVALLWLAATVTLAGTATTALLLLSETEVAPDTALFSDTVQVLAALLPNVDGAHESPVNVAGAGATKLRVTVLVTLFALAVTVAFCVALTSAAVAVKLALVCPEATTTLAGTVRFPVLLERPTVKPAVGAELSDTVHPVDPGVLIEELAQLTPVNEGVGAGRVSVPEPPVAGIELPPAVVATTPVI